MSFSETMQRMAGLLGQQPVGQPGIVAALPDDYLPPLLEESVFSIVLGAAVGFRSEISLLTFGSFIDQFGFELSQMRVALTAAAGSAEVIVATTLTGGTTAALMASDCGNRNTRLFQNTINTGAARTVSRTLVSNIICLTANEYVAIPGRFIVRGGPLSNHILVRPQADNVGIRLMGYARYLEKRSL